MRVTPDYFNTDAFLFNLDTEEELLLKLDYGFALFYTVWADLYPTGLDLKKEEEVGLDNFLKQVNSYAVRIKPTALVGPPFFIDWIDTDFQRQLFQVKSDPGIDEAAILRRYMENNALDYYEEDLDDAKHDNALPSLMRSIPHANKYLFPTKANTNEVVLDLLRIRICVAPNTKVSFSSKRMLQMLGIAAERRMGTRYVFANHDKERYQYFVGGLPPFVNQIMEMGKISVGPVMDSYFIERHIFFSRTEKRSNEDLFNGLKLYLDTLSKETNINFSISYTNATGLFAFQFPDHPAVQVTMKGDPELFQRLGYGLVAEINSDSVSKVFKVGQKDSESKAKILVFDTGHVVVTCQNTSSNLTSLTNNEFLASLFPMGVGCLELALCREDFPCVVPPIFEGGSGDSVPLYCHLWKFDDAGRLVPFKWVTGATISGVLRGKV